MNHYMHIAIHNYYNAQMWSIPMVLGKGYYACIIIGVRKSTAKTKKVNPHHPHNQPQKATNYI